METTKENQLKSRVVICKAIAHFKIFEEDEHLGGLCAYGKKLWRMCIFNDEEYKLFDTIVHKHIITNPVFKIFSLFHDPRSISKSKSRFDAYFWPQRQLKPRLDYLHYILEQYL